MSQMPKSGEKEPQEDKGTSNPEQVESARRSYEPFMEGTQNQILQRVQEGYDRFMETRVWDVPEWLYGPPKGTLFEVEVIDNPKFGETSKLQFDSARTAFVVVDLQIDFNGKNGYVDVMGYDLELTASTIGPIKKCLDAIRGTDMKIIHTREGHKPDLTDAPYNKILRSKVIGNGVGIGEKPEGGIGRLLVRGDQNWDIMPELYPREGELVIDKAGKGVMEVSSFFHELQNLDVSHLIITGTTTDVCVDTIMTQANDLGYWCMVLEDATGATKKSNKDASLDMVKMQGGVFGWVSSTDRLLKGMEDAGIRPSAEVHRIY
jgi:nicotinamidase-related amidase